jgi:hypothetical protein
VNLRRDHYRVHARKGRSPPYVIVTIVALADRRKSIGFGWYASARGSQTLNISVV